jgi:hypothetical protein
MAHNRQPDNAFEAAYQSTLETLVDQMRENSHVESWRFVEEVRENTGADGYFPDWIQPFVSFTGSILEGETTPDLLALQSAVLRAAQLGYTEGYFAGKDD